MGNIEKIEYSGIELSIGTRFYYKGRLCEVVETAFDHCSECVMECSDCVSLLCESENRHDNTEICFKWVEDEGGKIMKLSEIIDVECNDAAIQEVKKMVYRDLEIYAVKRSINTGNRIVEPFPGINTEWWCGYVEASIDIHNSLKGKGYLYKTILDKLEEYDIAPVHGGYTYISHGIPHVLDDDPRLFLGWDYNHYGDTEACVTYDDIIDEGKRVVDSMLEKMKEEQQ